MGPTSKSSRKKERKSSRQWSARTNGRGLPPPCPPAQARRGAQLRDNTSSSAACARESLISYSAASALLELEVHAAVHRVVDDYRLYYYKRYSRTLCKL